MMSHRYTVTTEAKIKNSDTTKFGQRCQETDSLACILLVGMQNGLATQVDSSTVS